MHFVTGVISVHSGTVLDLEQPQGLYTRASGSGVFGWTSYRILRKGSFWNSFLVVILSTCAVHQGFFKLCFWVGISGG